MNFYAGIGSRETPPEILELMEQLGYWLAEDACILRSGHAPGADQAFERGAAQSESLYGETNAEIYLPWPAFERMTPIAKTARIIAHPSRRAIDIASAYHPNWDRLTKGAKGLMARNTHQVLGLDCETPARFVLCWTKGAAMVGGTAQALRIAQDKDITIFNLADPEVEAICRGWLT